jgi:hypothetical protein
MLYALACRHIQGIVALSRSRPHHTHFAPFTTSALHWKPADLQGGGASTLGSFVAHAVLRSKSQHTTCTSVVPSLGITSLYHQAGLPFGIRLAFPTLTQGVRLEAGWKVGTQHRAWISTTRESVLLATCRNKQFSVACVRNVTRLIDTGMDIKFGHCRKKKRSVR